jgi:hypothetical protein
VHVLYHHLSPSTYLSHLHLDPNRFGDLGVNHIRTDFDFPLLHGVNDSTDTHTHTHTQTHTQLI